MLGKRERAQSRGEGQSGIKELRNTRRATTQGRPYGTMAEAGNGGATKKGVCMYGEIGEKRRRELQEIHGR